MIRSSRAPRSAAEVTKPARRLWPPKSAGSSPAAWAWAQAGAAALGALPPHTQPGSGCDFERFPREPEGGQGVQTSLTGGIPRPCGASRSSLGSRGAGAGVTVLFGPLLAVRELGERLGLVVGRSGYWGVGSGCWIPPLHDANGRNGGNGGIVGEWIVAI